MTSHVEKLPATIPIDTCRSCGTKIRWIEIGDSRIPLNHCRAHSYGFNGFSRDVEDQGLTYVSHFLSCPDATKWSKGKGNR